MTIQPIGGASVALFITPADLKEHGLTPAQLTLERALELTRAAFDEAGMRLNGAIEIEAYPDACGVLVFARIQAPERLWFSFASFEEVLAAVGALPASCSESELFWLDGRFFLSLPGAETRLGALLSEFGRVERGSPHIDARLAEHGRAILTHDAPAELLRRFAGPILPFKA